MSKLVDGGQVFNVISDRKSKAEVSDDIPGTTVISYRYRPAAGVLREQAHPYGDSVLKRPQT